MASVFVSHSSRDRAVTERVVALLRAAGFAAVLVVHSSRVRGVTERVVALLRAAGFAALFVDFDPERGIPAGRNWERELYAQLRRTDAVIFLASEVSVASRWCSAEL